MPHARQAGPGGQAAPASGHCRQTTASQLLPWPSRCAGSRGHLEVARRRAPGRARHVHGLTRGALASAVLGARGASGLSPPLMPRGSSAPVYNSNDRKRRKDPSPRPRACGAGPDGAAAFRRPLRGVKTPPPPVRHFSQVVCPVGTFVCFNRAKGRQEKGPHNPVGRAVDRAREAEVAQVQTEAEAKCGQCGRRASVTALGLVPGGPAALGPGPSAWGCVHPGARPAQAVVS